MAARLTPVPRFDLYRELEVDRSATPETIEAAWRSLAKRFHPDVVASKDTQARMKRLNVAHDWLSDAGLRARYDTGRDTAANRRTQADTSSAGSPRGHVHRSVAVTPPARVTLAAIATYGFYCLFSVVAAYAASVIAGALASATNVAGIVAAIAGEETALTVIQLLGNLLFVVLVGYFVASSFTSSFKVAANQGMLVVAGTLAGLAITFGLPAFVASYLVALAQWMGGPGAGLPAVAVVSVIEAAFVGVVVAIVGWMLIPEPEGRGRVVAR